MENKPEQAKESAPTKPSVENKKVSGPPVVSTTENKNIKPKFNEVSVDPMGFQELGSSLYGLDANPVGIFILVSILILFFLTFDSLGVSYNETGQQYGPLQGKTL